ncbi:Putative oxidoreductase MhqP [Planctomycetes bacterium Poly30]|uniref:Oxidoreductase MhqP n=1 Tax=Saltatorellus ferox TaxID=2528018 RepID=A0A518EZS0_9BACT|nr:Putative oxidoreductase MhqP [Planctomycetes bacterium Poly30]
MKVTRFDLGLLSLRLLTGAVFVFHGSQKLFGAFGGYGIEGTSGWMASIGIPFPTLSTYLAGGAEFFGGLAFLTGILTRLASLPVAFAMLVGAFTAHTGFDATQGGMEYPLVLAAAAVALGLTGPGRISLGRGRFDLPMLLPERHESLEGTV